MIEFQSKFEKLNLLINNAGVLDVSNSKTKDGFESNFGVNHLGHFLLTNLLMKQLQNAKKEDKENSRVIVVSSEAHRCTNIDWDNLNGEKFYSPYRCYAQSKLANLLFAYYMHQKFHQSCGINFFSVHPGVVNTQLFKDLGIIDKLSSILKTYLYRTPLQGALPILYLSTLPIEDKHSGSYFYEGNFCKSSANSYHLQNQKKLFEHSTVYTSAKW